MTVFEVLDTSRDKYVYFAPHFLACVIITWVIYERSDNIVKEPQCKELISPTQEIDAYVFSSQSVKTHELRKLLSE